MRQIEFSEWVKRISRPELTHIDAQGRLGYRQTVRLPGLPFPIHLIGLNTAWLCGDNEDPRKLWLTDGQVLRRTTNDQGETLDGLRLCLLHHPLSELVDESDCRRLLAERVDLTLRGHLHEAEPMSFKRKESWTRL